MNQLVLAVFAAAPFAFASLEANADFETNVGVSSKQLFRGENLSKDQLSLKAGFDADAYGFYFGSEVATINVDSEINGQYEVYGGYQFSLGNAAFGLGAIYRGFEDTAILGRFKPALDETSTTEYVASFGWENLGLSHYQEQDDLYQYTELRNTFAIGSTMGMDLTLGNYAPEVGDAELDLGVNFVATLQNDSEMSLKLSYIHEKGIEKKSETNFVLTFSRRFGY